MAVGIYNLPICDGCKLPWLPIGWTQDSDPRNLREGAKPLRCGKCKSIGWDREFVKQQKIAVDVVQPMELDVDPAAEDISAGPVHEENVSIDEAKRLYAGAELVADPLADPNRIEYRPKTQHPRCKHRMTDCPICHPKEAA